MLFSPSQLRTGLYNTVISANHYVQIAQ